MIESLIVRRASDRDLGAIRRIYNEGIEDRVATLETQAKSVDEIATWFEQHDERSSILVALDGNAVVGWASLNQFSHRCAHSAIADLSVYISRAHRGSGIGTALLVEIKRYAKTGDFHKIVLHALNDNEPGKRLYKKSGFTEVGIFREHGKLDGRYVDVVAMEMLLP